MIIDVANSDENGRLVRFYPGAGSGLVWPLIPFPLDRDSGPNWTPVPHRFMTDLSVVYSSI